MYDKKVKRGETVPETSIVVKAEDRYSDAIKKMSSYTKSFNKTVDALEDDLRALSKNKYDLKLDLSKAQKSLKDAERQFDQTGSAADGLKLQLAQANYDNIKRNLEAVTRAAKDTERQIQKVTQETQKSTSVAKEELTAKSTSSLLSGFKWNEFGKLISPAVEQGLSVALDSALGQPTASLISSMGANTISGAMLGLGVGGPMGAAIGGAVGLAAGTISGGMQMFSAKDDAFKSYVQTAVEDQMTAIDQTLTSGSAVAGSREQSRLAFVQWFGSDDAADEYLGKVREMAKGTNYTYDEIIGYSKSLLNTYAPDDVFGVLQTLSDASAGLSLGESDVNVMIQGLARMRTTGKATQEYLNYFSERGVDVYSALSNATGADKSQIAGMVSKGQISGDTAAQAILEYINETFGGLSDNLANTYNAMVNNLADDQAELNAAMGQGYNDARKEGIQAQRDWLSGDSGSKVSEAYEAIGAFKASLENTKEELERQYIDEAMASDEYKSAEAEGNAAEMGRMIMEAKVKAQNEYNASEGAQLLLESELSLIDSVRSDTTLNTSYYDSGYRLGQEFSKGRLAGAKGDSRFASIVATTGAGAVADYSSITGFATGLQRVPYDNFPALLHEDERVLTASEARNYNGGGTTVNVSGNTFIVRQDSDVDDIAAAIADKLALAQMGGVAQ